MIKPVYRIYPAEDIYSTFPEDLKMGYVVVHWPNGKYKYFHNGKYHRIDGPAITYANGRQTWWVYGHSFKNTKEYQVAAELSDEEMLVIILKYGRVE